MDKILLVRYGQHTGGTLTNEGKRSMISVAQKIRAIQNIESCKIICADIPRAVESATIIAHELNISPPIPTADIYAAEEDGITINVLDAISTIQAHGANVTTLIAVASREYIETLPGTIIGQSNHVAPHHLQRGEVLLINLQSQEITLS